MLLKKSNITKYSPALYGGDFGDIVGGGISGGFIGGVSGAIIGGVSGGLNAVGNDRDFWSGSIIESNHGGEIGGDLLKNGDFFLDEKIPAGHKPTDTGEIARTGNPDYGKYGWTRKYANGDPKMHKGVDYVGEVGDNVYAMYDGKVTYSGYSKSYGENFVRIRSLIGNKTYNVDYGHMSKSFVTVGNKVTAGQRIGLMGRLGNLSRTTAPTHVHISIFRYVNGNRGFVKPWWNENN